MKVPAALIVAVAASAAPVKTPMYSQGDWSSLLGIPTVLPHKANETTPRLHSNTEASTPDAHKNNGTATLRPHDDEESKNSTTSEILWSSLVMLGSRSEPTPVPPPSPNKTVTLRPYIPKKINPSISDAQKSHPPPRL